MSKFKKIVFSVVVVVFLIVSMCPTFAFAYDPLLFNCAEPYVSNTSGYIAVRGTRTDLNDATQGFIIFYNITPVSNDSMSYVGDTPLIVIDDVGFTYINFHINGDLYTNYVFSYGFIHQDGFVQNINSFEFTDNINNLSFTFNSNFKIHDLDFKGNFDTSNIDFLYYNFDYLFASDKYDYLHLASIVSALQIFGDLQQDELEKLDSIVNNMTSISSAIQDIKTSFGTKLDTIISDNVVFKQRLEELLEYLQSIDSNTDDVESWLNTIYTDFVDIYFLIEGEILQILDAVDELEGYTDELEDLLRQIVDLLNSSGSSDLTSPDTSQLDNYYEIEQGLINRTDVDVSNAVQVDIDQNAMAVTWNLIDSFLNSNGKVFGLFLTVLSLGIIALILGR